jgi:hypothetical protein
MRRLACLIAIGSVLAGAADASAALYRGSSPKGTSIKLRTNVQGKPTRVTFGPYEAQCSNGYDAVRNPIEGFKPPFDAASSQRILDRGRLNDRREGYRVKAEWNFRAQHSNDDRWVGRYRTSARFLSDGDVYTRCSVGLRFDLKRK